MIHFSDTGGRWTNKKSPSKKPSNYWFDIYIYIWILLFIFFLEGEPRGHLHEPPKKQMDEKYVIHQPVILQGSRKHSHRYRGTLKQQFWGGQFERHPQKTQNNGFLLNSHVSIEQLNWLSFAFFGEQQKNGARDFGGLSSFYNLGKVFWSYTKERSNIGTWTCQKKMENLSKLFQFQLLVFRGVLQFVPECHTIHCVAGVEDFVFP